MNRFFNLDNPVWRFVGNIADMFLLSLLWYLSCLPLFTAGAATTAVYYVTLKLVRNQEGYTFASFRKSFALNFKQGTLIWLLFAAVGLILGADIYWGIHNASGVFLLPAFLIVALIYLLNLAFIFPFLARCQNTTKAILKMNFAISHRWSIFSGNFCFLAPFTECPRLFRLLKLLHFQPDSGQISDGAAGVICGIFIAE